MRYSSCFFLGSFLITSSTEWSISSLISLSLRFIYLSVFRTLIRTTVSFWRDWTMFYYFRLCIFAVVKMDNRNLYTNKQNIMEAKYITLTKENIEKEHICCAFSDKKCKDSYELKRHGWKMSLRMAMFSDGLTNVQKYL